MTRENRWAENHPGDQPIPTFIGPGPAGPVGDDAWLPPASFVDDSDRGVADARRITLALLTAEVTTLVATGIYLFLFYRPAGPARPEGFVGVVLDLHRLVALASIPTGVAAVVLLAVSVLGERHWCEALAAAALVIMAMAGAITGAWLAWDQIALKTVTVGTDLSGYWFLFDGSARFVLIGGHEVSVGQLAFSLVVHSLILATATVTLLAAIWKPLSGPIGRCSGAGPMR